MSRAALWGCVAASLAAVAFVDHATGIELAFSIFYLVPVYLASAHAGLGPGLAVSAAAALTWFWVDSVLGQHPYLNPAAAYWNTAVRLSFFVIVTVLLSRARQRLELELSVSRLKSDMLSAVSHEFGNSVAVLQLATVLLKETDGDAGAADKRRALYGMLERVAAKLKATAEQFLSEARLSSGRFALTFQDVAVRSFVNDVLVWMRPVAQSKGVAVSFDPPEKIYVARADPDALELILSNLIGNAIKYTPAGGSVRIGIAPAGGGVEVSVEDTGIGIPEAQQGRVLEGHRTDEGRKMSSGHGVGLRLAKELIEGHGAVLGLRSAPGKGSRFSFVLPLAQR